MTLEELVKVIPNKIDIKLTIVSKDRECVDLLIGAEFLKDVKQITLSSEVLHLMHSAVKNYLIVGCCNKLLTQKQINEILQDYSLI